MHSRQLRLLATLVVATLFLVSCATTYVSKMEKTETAFNTGSFQTSVDEIRTLAQKAEAKDKLLTLMEAGIILHTMGEYAKSTKALEDADYIAETIKKSITKEALSFMINDAQANFTGENFERVQIKLYLALNALALGDFDGAKRKFRKMNYELREMKFFDQEYKQNLSARYIDAILSEKVGEWNDAGVAYRNLLTFNKSIDVRGDLYVLAEKSDDADGKREYGSFKNSLPCFDRAGNRIPWHKGLAEVLIVNEAGKAAVKACHGKIADDAAFYDIMKVSLDLAIANNGNGMSAAMILPIVSQADNPIPVYRRRDPQGALPVQLGINGKTVGALNVLDSFSVTAMRNYNDSYQKIVTKNVASLATKIVVGVVASEAGGNEIAKQLGIGNLGATILKAGLGAGAGAIIKETTRPDLRAWRLLADNMQVMRVWVEPGEYQLDASFPYPDPVTTWKPQKLTLATNDLKVLVFRSMTHDTNMQPVEAAGSLDPETVKKELQSSGH